MRQGFGRAAASRVQRARGMLLRTVAPVGSFAAYSVGDFQRLSWDHFDITGSFDPGVPVGIKLASALAAAPAAAALRAKHHHGVRVRVMGRPWSMAA